MTRYILLTIIALVLAGCASTRVVDAGQPSAYAEINEQAARKTARLHLAGGRELEVTGLHVAPDSASYFNAGGQLHSVATAEIERVTFLEVRRGRGALQGAGLGAAIGFGAGFLLGVVTDKRDCETLGDEDCDFFQLTPAENGVLVGALLGTLGGTAGLVVGTVRGSSKVYRFAPEGQPLAGEQSASLTPEKAPE